MRFLAHQTKNVVSRRPQESARTSQEDKFVLSIHANRFPAVLIQGEETVHHGSCVALVGELKSNAKG
ncbi:hypothetical protein PCANC_20344 [Puccinia coronata f. sp. avenae]|uniref:Uncharacterized protein n=1 Tax=Puccinia coronata f. sp. avenae TaxID=200324 RepID=A0A2N5UG32_9BASI|nr:hypothetical protein PCANC_22948 [Puccinia coronata f. sp. avenae]PLW36695.1 hypothetical protein PCANC_20344 [Puccinia coronata f. sp. avenae]